MVSNSVPLPPCLGSPLTLHLLPISTPSSRTLWQCYVTERQQIALLVSLLSGKGAEWAKAVHRADSDVVHSYPEFARQLKLMFAHPESEVETNNRLWHLRPGSQSVSHYAAKFRTLAFQAIWGKAALRTGFYEGLLPRIKDELA